MIEIISSGTVVAARSKGSLGLFETVAERDELSGLNLATAMSSTV